LRFVTGFYWDRDHETRAWSKRFFDRHGCMPTSAQAAVYSAIRHYLRAIAAAGTDEAKAVMAKMREIPVDDFYTRGGKLREDGRLLHDMYFVQVKTPAESSGPWDYYKVIAIRRFARRARMDVLSSSGDPLRGTPSPDAGREASDRRRER
jgi:branched-chain amino acid transport system substrate-binding protein